MTLDTNALLAIIAVCVTIAFCLFFLAFQRLIKATMFGKIQCGACQGKGRIYTTIDRDYDHKNRRWIGTTTTFKKCDTCGATGYLLFKVRGKE
jgi:hypothetical protein